MHLENYVPRKAGLDNCLKNPAWEDALTGNMVNVSKHSFNLNDSKFTIFIDHSESNWVEKSHS